MVLEEALRNGLILCEKGRELLEANGLKCASLDATTGYWKVGKHAKIHRIIAPAGVPNPYNLPCVNHINGVKADNRLENLEWCTRSHNTQHAYDTGLLTPAWLNKSGKQHPRSIPVVGVHKKTGERISFESGSLASAAGFYGGHISSCITGNSLSHKGYRWFRADDPRLSIQT